MRNFDMHGKGHGRGLGRHRMGKGIVIGAVLFVVLKHHEQDCANHDALTHTMAAQTTPVTFSVHIKISHVYLPVRGAWPAGHVPVERVAPGHPGG